MRPAARAIVSATSVALLALLAACSDKRAANTADVARLTERTPITASAPQLPPLRLSVAAMESPRDTFSTYSRIVAVLEAKLGRKVELVQRRTYREVNDLLVAGQLDVAFLCTGGYLELRTRAPGAVEVVALPMSGGRTTYQSLVIVPADSPAKTLQDLAGKRFAFTDELSLSGRAYVADVLTKSGNRPEAFFGSIIYTRSHDRSISSVAQGLVDGAAVHSGLFAHVLAEHSPVGSRVRVIHRSPEFGASPVVVSSQLSSDLRDKVRDAVLTLTDGEDGAAALRVLHVEKFVPPPPGSFDSAERVVQARP